MKLLISDIKKKKPVKIVPSLQGRRRRIVGRRKNCPVIGGNGMPIIHGIQMGGLNVT